MGEQSPINITRENCKQFNPQPLAFSSYCVSRQAVAQNDGVMVKLVLGETEQPPRLSGGDLKGTYDLREIQFRWGPTNNLGTEHALNGKKFSLEAQLIHYKSEYRNVPEDAFAKLDGIVIVSFFFQVACAPRFPGCNENNSGLVSLTETLRNIQEPSSTSQLDIRDLMILFGEKATPEGYFTYFGSLTTPDYYQVVTWILYQRNMGQSPIDITRENCSRFDPPPLKYWHYWNYSEPVTVVNTGDTVKLVLDEDATNPKMVNGGHLDGSYELRHIEFRWGPQDYLGTEHTFNGKRFSMEAQLVHQKDDYRNSYEKALKHKDGLVIISFFLQVACSAANTECNADNIGIQPLVTMLNKVPEPNSAVSMKITQLLNLLETKATPAGYFTYPGSITCPNYEEAVTWILYPTLIIVSHNQLEAFRNLKSMNGTPIAGNFRNTQPLEGRTILYC